uniref:Uncharacterized protein n=1 Tax=viral metagenome TaxID=1070528 RepID=A0A6M3IHV1_9ZZZZ
MPTQIFKISRAPEAPPLKPDDLFNMLYHSRRDTEWAVEEVNLPNHLGEIVKRDKEPVIGRVVPIACDDPDYVTPPES